jgi:hypothetical protein
VRVAAGLNQSWFGAAKSTAIYRNPRRIVLAESSAMSETMPTQIDPEAVRLTQFSHGGG